VAVAAVNALSPHDREVVRLGLDCLGAAEVADGTLPRAARALSCAQSWAPGDGGPEDATAEEVYARASNAAGAALAGRALRHVGARLLGHAPAAGDPDTWERFVIQVHAVARASPGTYATPICVNVFSMASPWDPNAPVDDEVASPPPAARPRVEDADFLRANARASVRMLTSGAAPLPRQASSVDDEDDGSGVASPEDAPTLPRPEGRGSRGGHRRRRRHRRAAAAASTSRRATLALAPPPPPR